MVCSPYTKYVFVKPREGGEYNVQEFIDWRDTWSSYTPTSINAVGGFVFWLGDSSSCGGTEIALRTDDPMQAFLRDDDTRTEFCVANIARGGFFLLGDRQSAAMAATEIKKITLDCNLDFIVLAIHQKPGTSVADISLTAVRHLIASIRWDVGPRKPIILMMGARGDIVGADNDTLHIMSEQVRGNMFVGDITDQTTAEKQTALVDRAGYLALNWWPMVAFTPNSAGGLDVRNSMSVMDNRLFHPLLIPKSGSGCPFNTNRDLTASELYYAEQAFEQPDLFPLADPKVRTTSVWFWDFDTVKNSSYVRSWTVPRGNLDATVAHLDYMSDMQVVFESTPSWVGHPVFDMDFAMEFRMEQRSLNTMVQWEKDSSGPGTIPDLHGVKDQQEGWLTVITPFELSPTATRFYEGEGDADTVPAIPTWAKFLWMREISQESLTSDSPNWLGIPGLPSPGELVEGLLDLLEDALLWIPNRLGIANNTEGLTKWSAGLNQPHVVMYGKPQYPDDDEDIGGGVTKLNLESAPFAIQIQTRNFKMNGDLGFVWPARVFNIIPIAIDAIVQQFDPALTPAGLTDWHDLWLDAIGGAGTTPLQFEMGAVATNELLDIWPTHIETRIVPFDILEPLLDHKGDFPPMLDNEITNLGRDLSSQLARIDITHPQIRRVRETCPGCGRPGSPPGGGGHGSGFGIAAAIKNWPMPEDREITITQDYYGTYAPYVCVEHRSLDMVYSDGSHSYSTPILAVAEGTCVTGRDSANGPWVRITHPIPPLPSQDTFTSFYCHLSQTLVEDGEYVYPGHQIGTMGREGWGNSLHLHFQLRRGPTCNDTINPCDVMPPPVNGIAPPHENCYRVSTAPDPSADVKTMICQTVENELALYGADPYWDDDYGNRLRKSTLAVAIAIGESGLFAGSQNCFCYGPQLFDITPEECRALGGEPYSHVGLFQIQNPTQIGNDIAAGIVSAESVTYDDCWGVEVAQDYKYAYNNVMAFLRMSSMMTYLGHWDVYNGGSYLNHLAPAACPPETWAQP